MARSEACPVGCKVCTETKCLEAFDKFEIITLNYFNKPTRDASLATTQQRAEETEDIDSEMEFPYAELVVKHCDATRCLNATDNHVLHNTYICGEGCDSCNQGDLS